ncbi:glycosyltransferase [Segatella copri]|uniref:Glycosyltransferase n=1 Tax=Segatella copri TaxID=165179 RepID=A0AAW5V421_9BACT|nr:glycosyltransferase [Segatella copri]MCW4141088.1 glycosyltransferase [Segatella copri]MCW4146080.1 glycosyltransferase [Segatella copri]MCW4165672.1 glycosyltransferase [Segatella copri]
MKNDNILVSVVCDVYNHEPYLRQCFDGFVMQKTNFKFEVLVHDDASTDKSAEIIIEYTNKYPDIFKPIIQKENQYSKGVGIWKTYQFPRVKGKYVAFCEGDDYWIDPLKLQKQVTAIESDSKNTMVYTAFSTVDETGNSIYRYDLHYNMCKSKSGNIFPFLLFRNVVMTVSCMVNRNVLESKLYLDCNKSLDYNLFLAASSLGNCIYLDYETCSYRKVGNSMTNSNSNIVQQRFLQVWEYYVDIILNNLDQRIIADKKLTLNLMLAKSIDLWLKGLGAKYLKKVISCRRMLWHILPACFLEIQYLFSYNIKKLFIHE